MVDLSTYFSHDIDSSEYNVLEPPLGLMSLLSYINKQFGDRVEGRIFKPRIDFDSLEEFFNVISHFCPDIIGIRSLTLYKSFFHAAIAYIRKRAVVVPIIAGGPYSTGSYTDLLQDQNINLAVIAEGEITLAEILEKTLANNKRFPDTESLRKIPGVAFSEGTVGIMDA